MKILGLLFLVVGLLGCSKGSPSSSVQLTPLQQGAQLSRRCVMCHGPKGISRVASYPSLAGLSADYIAAQLQAFKSGARVNPVMANMAVNLSDQDIQLLANYYQSLASAELPN